MANKNWVGNFSNVFSGGGIVSANIVDSFSTAGDFVLVHVVSLYPNGNDPTVATLTDTVGTVYHNFFTFNFTINGGSSLLRLTLFWGKIAAINAGNVITATFNNGQTVVYIGYSELSGVGYMGTNPIDGVIAQVTANASGNTVQSGPVPMTKNPEAIIAGTFQFNVVGAGSCNNPGFTTRALTNAVIMAYNFNGQPGTNVQYTFANNENFLIYAVSLADVGTLQKPTQVFMRGFKNLPIEME